MGLTQVICDPANAPVELRDALSLLGQEYPIAAKGEGIHVVFEKTNAHDGPIVILVGHEAAIRYEHRHEALRAVGSILSGIVSDGVRYEERNRFKALGIMLDCSRNAVMRVDHLKKWLNRLALLGFNTVMLYTEDVFDLPGQDYFGYMRGRYSRAELKAIEQHASGLGIEMVGCIQTLGHLHQMLQWSAFDAVKDTLDVMMVGEEATYDLIEQMISVFKDTFSSRRIHVGMDEAHDMGRGRYMDRKGHRPGFDIFIEHLARVVKICRKQGLEPIIWSDMFFRMGAPDMTYRHPDTAIPQEVIDAIPKGVQMVYWDYYQKDKAGYVDWLKRHRDIGCEPIMASGIWTWQMPWLGSTRTLESAAPCVDACIETNVEELLFTLWGDDGAICDMDSALAGLTYVAEKAYAAEGVNEERLERRFAGVCGADYRANMDAGKMNDQFRAASVLWDDPLLGILYHHSRTSSKEVNWQELRDHFAELYDLLEPHSEDTGAGDLSHARLLLRVMKEKMDVRSALIAAYEAKDRTALDEVRTQIAPLCDSIRQLLTSWRSQWMSRNKSFGFEVIQIRLGGLLERYKELETRLDEYTSGRIAAIEELDQKPEAPLPELDNLYQTVASGTCRI